MVILINFLKVSILHSYSGGNGENFRGSKRSNKS